MSHKMSNNKFSGKKVKEKIFQFLTTVQWKKKHRKQQKMLAALFWTTKNKKFSLVTCDFLDWMTYYWKRKIMSKTIIITIHFPILFIIIISLFTFYLSFIFCAITLINSILKKIPFFSCLYTSSIFVFTSFQSFAYIRW